MSLYRTPEGIKHLSFSQFKVLPGETYIIGQYASEVAGELELESNHIIDRIPSMQNMIYKQRNLVVTDVLTANSIFWHRENSRIRNFANNALLIPNLLQAIDAIWGPGFSQTEVDVEHNWKWCIGEGRSGILGLHNRSGQPKSIRVSFFIEHNFQEKIQIKVILNDKQVSVIENNQLVDLCLNLENGMSKLELVAPKDVQRAPSDDVRRLNFRVIDFQIVHDYSRIGAEDYFSRWQLHDSGYESVQEIASSGVVSYSDGFQNEPLIDSIHLRSNTSMLAWYLAKAVISDF